jgi:hypothetical protein
MATDWRRRATVLSTDCTRRTLGLAAVLALGLLGCAQSSRAPEDADGIGDCIENRTEDIGRGDAEGEAPAIDVEVRRDASDAAPDCVSLPGLGPWILEAESEAIAALTGDTEIVPGVRIFQRFTPEEKDLARSWLAGAWAAQGFKVEHEHYGEGTNLIGRLEPTVPGDEWVIFGAHLDTVEGTPGADDDASGLAVLTALARVAAELPCRSRHVVLLATDQEEDAFQGSEAFANWLISMKIQVHSVHLVDMVGWDGDGNRAVELDWPSDELLLLYQDVAAAAGLDMEISGQFEFGTDATAFRAYGFQATGVSEAFYAGDTTPYYHTKDDVLDSLDLNYMEAVTVLIANVLFELTS